MGIPVPSGMSDEQILSCERFSLLVWGKTLFEYEPSHNGRHGYACEECVAALEARDAELERIRAIPQPWEAKAA